MNAISLKKCVIKLLIILFDSIPDRYKTQEICDKVVSEKHFMLKYCLGRHWIQEMCDKAADACVPALPGWLQIRCYK